MNQIYQKVKTKPLINLAIVDKRIILVE